MSDSFFPGMHEFGGLEGDLTNGEEAAAADAAQDENDLSDDAAGVYAPDANAPDDDAMTDDDAVTADDAISTGETHADDLGRGGVAPR